MADQLIEPDQLPHWVPGQLTVHSPAEGWDGLSVRFADLYERVASPVR